MDKVKPLSTLLRIEERVGVCGGYNTTIHFLASLGWENIIWKLDSHDLVKKQTKTRTTRTPAFWGCPPPPHDYPYYWFILDPNSKEDKVKATNLKNSPKFWNKHYTRHTFWCCLIRCANMKWIQLVLLKIQSGHDSVHRWTDGQGETSIPPFQLCWSGGYKIWPSKPRSSLFIWTHWGREKMTAIFYTTYSKPFSSMKIVFWLKFHWNLLPRVQLTIM